MSSATLPPFAAWRRSLALCAVLFGACGPTPAPKPHAAPPGRLVELDEGIHAVELTKAAVKRTRIETAQVQPQPSVARTRIVPGVIVARPGGRADIRAPLSGTLLAVQPERRPGDKIAAGQWLARLRPIVTPQRFIGIEAKAAFEAAQARKDAAQANATRVAGLRKDGSISARAVEQAKADLADAQAQLLSARAQLERLGRRALDADVVVSIRSPMSGTVTGVNAPIGQLVDTGTPLFTVVDLTALWVQATVYAGDLEQVSPDAPARVRILGSEKWVAAPRTAQPDLGVVASPNVSVMFTLEGVDHALPLGARVEVALATRPLPATVSVPASATFYDSLGRPQVYVARTAQQFVRTPIDIVTERDGQVFLRRGPPEGTRVVTVGVPELLGTEEGVGH